MGARSRVNDAAATAEQALSGRVGRVDLPTGDQVAVLPLSPQDLPLIEDLRLRASLPSLNPKLAAWLTLLPAQVDAARADLKAEIGWTRMFAGRNAKQKATEASQWIRDLVDHGTVTDLPRVLREAAPLPRDSRQSTLSTVLDPTLGVVKHLGHAPRGHSVILPGDAFSPLASAANRLSQAAALDSKLREQAKTHGDQVRHAETMRLLGAMPVERLREATNDRIPLGPLRKLGLGTVGQVLEAEHRLTRLEGIGDLSAKRIAGAAHALRQTTYDEMPVRLDIRARTPEATRLLEALRAWDAFRAATRSLAADTRLVDRLKPISDGLSAGATHFALTAVDENTLDGVLSEVRALSARLATYQADHDPAGDAWGDFLQRPATFFTMLSELGFANENEEKVQGDLPQDIIDAIRALELRADHLNVSLRGYQSFAARFAIVQKRVLIGDEMGLGKTVEALAVLAHLRSTGKTHFLVLCPAAVVTNWVREVASKTDLPAHRLHGSERDSAMRNWRRRGGVAVTTYESLGWYCQHTHVITIDCLVADEAHAIKNPAAKRSERSAKLLALASRSVLMTGTPLENRVDEFRQLVTYVRPDLTLDSHDHTPARFRRQVAPAYLRRNQEDVLTELPERVDVDEWLPLSPTDLALYRDAVHSGNFMAMRQAAMLGSLRSQKVVRLLELIREAEDNGRKVIVYSYFREVLNLVRSLISGHAFGPINGSVPAHLRQRMVDDFTAAPEGAVLVSQIQAGGVGLNIQAASVVILCEPQLKPTTEDQAIARAHRMGQVQSVQVHRLLSEEGVDSRIIEILSRKRGLFDEFARHSATAQSAPEAFDLSEAELARQIVSEERQRLCS
jgi:superfamily II DNA or RNA helicase